MCVTTGWGCHWERGSGVRDAAEHRTMHGTAPTAKKYPAPESAVGGGTAALAQGHLGGVRTQCTTGQGWSPPHSPLFPAELMPASSLWLKRNHGLSSTEVGTLPEKHPREAPRATRQNGLTKLLLGSNIGGGGSKRGRCPNTKDSGGPGQESTAQITAGLQPPPPWARPPGGCQPPGSVPPSPVGLTYPRNS